MDQGLAGALHRWDLVLYGTVMATWIVAVIALVHGFIRLRTRATRSGGEAVFLRNALIAGCCIGWSLMVSQLDRWGAEAEFEAVLRAPIASILIDGQPAPEKRVLVSRLLDLHDEHPDHSVPSARHAIEILGSRGSVRINIRQDSMDPQIYWVYFPSFRLTRTRAIGLVRIPPSAALSAIL